MRTESDVVIGGGLTGLTAALLLARAGRRVALFEKASEVGGRAATHEEGGALFNLGPHALYQGGAASRTLAELGVEPTGSEPAGSGRLALDRDRLHALPVGFTSMLSTTLLRFSEKREAARILQALPKLDAAAQRGTPLGVWIDRVARRPGTRRLLHAFVRVSTYTEAPDRLDAGAALAQLQLAFSAGVRYVDGGWRTIVDALRERAVAAGVAVHTSARVAAVAPGRVELAGGEALRARAVVIAASPAAARALVPSSAAIAAAERAAVPVHAACLDLALSSLARPRATFCLGIDQPLYYSLHSASARLAPEGIHVIHAARYLAPGETADASSLEALVDRLQPGWRDHVVARRFLPQLVVANDLHEVGRSRPGPEVADAPGVFLAGDWVGGGAMLADAAIASASAAVSCILHREERAMPAIRDAQPAGAEAAWS